MLPVEQKDHAAPGGKLIDGVVNGLRELMVVGLIFTGPAIDARATFTMGLVGAAACGSVASRVQRSVANRLV
jgi:hypothetical protein